jgi:hypothetical protein
MRGEGLHISNSRSELQSGISRSAACDLRLPIRGSPTPVRTSSGLRVQLVGVFQPSLHFIVDVFY